MIKRDANSAFHLYRIPTTAQKINIAAQQILRLSTPPKLEEKAPSRTPVGYQIPSKYFYKFIV